LQIVAARANLKDEKYACTKMSGHGVISHDGMSHASIVAVGRSSIRKYPWLI
jgi:hypothetical protein